MQILIDRGVNRLFNKLVVKNGRENISCPWNKNRCIIEAKPGNEIVVRLSLFPTNTMTIAKFTCESTKEIVQISPTMFCKRWEWLNFKLFPYLSIFLLALAMAEGTEEWKWAGALMTAMTAVSVMCQQFAIWIPTLRDRFFNTTVISQ
ncbi:MAG: hypothetical protein HDS03_05835 [Bacteroides sp.]|nr:hypothetical protein [Bacteroides sp.]